MNDLLGITSCIKITQAARLASAGHGGILNLRSASILIQIPVNFYHGSLLTSLNTISRDPGPSDDRCQMAFSNFISMLLLCFISALDVVSSEEARIPIPFYTKLNLIDRQVLFIFHHPHIHRRLNCWCRLRSVVRILVMVVLNGEHMLSAYV